MWVCSVCFVNLLGCWYLSNISLKSPWFIGKCSLNIWFNYFKVLFWGFPGGSDGKESTCNVEDLGLIPGLGRSPGEGNGYPLQYSYLENPMVRGARWAVVHRVAKSWTWRFHYFPICLWAFIILVNLRVTWQIAENQWKSLQMGRDDYWYHIFLVSFFMKVTEMIIT